MHLQTDMSELRERVFHLHTLTNNLPGLMMYQVIREQNGKMKFIYLSESVKEFTGRSAAEVIRDPSILYDLILEEDRIKIAEAEEASLKDMSVFDIEIRSKNADGEIRWLHLRSAPRKLDNGTVVWDGIHTDITQRKEAELELKRSNDRFELIAATTQDALWELNLQDNEIWANEMHQRLYGLTKNDPVPKEEMWQQRIHPDDKESAINEFEKAINSDKSIWIAEYRFYTEEKGYRNIYDRTYIVRDELGKPIHIMGSMTDITEQVKAVEQFRKVQHALEESEKKLRYVLTSMAEDFYAIDLNYRVIVINQVTEGNLEEMWGKAVKTGDNILEKVPPSERDRIEQNFKKVFQGEKIEYEVEHATPGSLLWVVVSISPVMDEKGVITGAHIITKDISERKKAEEKTKQSEERYRLLIEQASDAIMITDINGNFCDVNSSLCEMFGYTKEELLQLNIRKLIDPQQLAKEPMRFDELREGRHVFSHRRMLHKKGNIIDVEANVKMIPDGSVVAIARDITERKKTEQALKKSHERYELIGSATNDAIWDWDLKTNERWGNESFYQLYGLNRKTDTLNDLVPFAKTHPDDVEKLKASLETAFKQKASLVTEEYRFRMIDGSYKTFLDRAFIQYDDNGTPIRLIGAMQDITGRKRSEEEIRKSNERFEMIATTTHDAIWEWNLETDEFWANEMHQSLYGLTINDPVPLVDEWKSRIHPDDLHATTTAQEKALISSQNAWISEYRFRTTNNEYRDIYDRTYVVRNAEGKAIHLMGSMMDITERKKAEVTLRTLNDRYYALMNSVDGIVWQADAKTFEFSFVSKQAERLLGYPVEQWLTEPNFWRNHIYEDDRNWAVNYCVECTSEKRSHEFEYRMLAADGKIVWLRDIVTVQAENDEPIELSGIMVDITERKKAENDLIREKNLSDSIINSMPGIFYLFDENGKYLRWNKNLEVVSGYTFEEIDSLSPLDFFKGADKIFIKKKIEQVFENGSADTEAYFVTKDQNRIPYYFNGWRVIFEGKPCVIGVGIDITQRLKTEKEILEVNERFNLIAKATNDFVWDADLVENKIWRNDNYNLQLGWKRDGNTEKIDEWEDHIHPDDKERVTTRLKKILKSTKESIWVEEYRFQKADGTFITAYDRGYIMRDERSEAYRIIGAMTDISAIKETEELLKKSYSDIRRLASHLEKVREEERIAIAREIHDELGQQLTVLKMDISWLNKNLSLTDTKQIQRMADLLQTIDTTIKNVRRISSELRPSVLDDLGLLAAIEWLLRDFEKRSGFRTKFISEVGELNLDINTKTALFRIAQESLTNVARHAQATEVTVCMKVKDHELIITLMDNGKGFIINSIENKKTLGILGMRERIAKINGTFTIDSTPGKGTTIDIRVPVSSQTEPKTKR